MFSHCKLWEFGGPSFYFSLKALLIFKKKFSIDTNSDFTGVLNKIRIHHLSEDNEFSCYYFVMSFSTSCILSICLGLYFFILEAFPRSPHACLPAHI